MGATRAKVYGLTIAGSIAVHAAVTGALFLAAVHTFAADKTAPVAVPADTASDAALAIDLVPAGLGISLEHKTVDLVGEPPRIMSGQEVSRVDTGVGGRGGDAVEREQALNLADEDSRMRVSPDLLNRLDRDQLQRLRATRARASWEDRRSTTHPAELTFVASGTGTILARRPKALYEPSRGVEQSPPPSVYGSVPGSEANPEKGDRRPFGARAGARETAPGPGLIDRRPGVDHRVSVPIAHVRPAVWLGAVAVPAVDHALPTDDVDDPQEVATLVRSIIHASTAGGPSGDGAGGSGGGGEAGAGAQRGTGSRATPLGDGAGNLYDYWTNDPRLVDYFRRLHAKIDPLWANAFPKSALFDLRQGTVILDFTVFADGHVDVTWPPVRPSGIEEFDRNCADAIRRAGPFAPIPPELGTSRLRIRAPFVANNPIVK